MAEKHLSGGPYGSPLLQISVRQSIFLQPMTSSTMRSRPTICIWALSLCCSAVLVVFAYFMYPLPDGDSIFFIPTIVNHAKTGSFHNMLVDLSFKADPSGLGRALFHTAGTPLFFGSLLSLLGEKSYQNALILLALVRSASVFIFSRIIILSLKRSSRPVRLFHVLIAFMLVISNAFFLFASHGRPEILSILIISASLLAVFSFKPKFKRHFSIQICLGLLFSVSIMNSLLGLSFYLIYLVFDVRSFRTRIVYFGMALAFSCLFFVMSYGIAAVPVIDGIQGIMIQAKGKINPSSTFSGLPSLVFYWKSWAIFGVLSLVRLGGQSLHLLRDRRHSFIDRLWLISSLLVLLVFVYLFGLRAANTHYQLYAFLPIYQILSLQLVLNIAGHRSRFPGLLWSPAIFLAALLSLLAPLQTILLFPYYLSSGSTYVQMKLAYENVDVSNCSTVYSTGIYVLDEKQVGSVYARNDKSEILLTERIKMEQNASACVVAFVQEASSHSPAPVNMKLIADYRDRSPWTAKLRSLRLLNSPKGYSFAAYRQDLEPEQN